jgi:hypothetical protein
MPWKREQGDSRASLVRCTAAARILPDKDLRYIVFVMSPRLLWSVGTVKRITDRHVFFLEKNMHFIDLYYLAVRNLLVILLAVRNLFVI